MSNSRPEVILDPFTMPYAGMIFVLLVILMSGMFKLLQPLAARFGSPEDPRLEDRTEGSLAGAEEIAELRQAVEDLHSEVARLSEKQQFTERLLEARPPVNEWAAEQD